MNNLEVIVLLELGDIIKWHCKYGRDLIQPKALSMIPEI